jgi:hypothetical protein
MASAQSQLSIFFYNYGEKHRSKVTTKKYVLNHSILYVHCVELLIWSPTQFDFSFYDCSVIYYDFSKLLQRVICPVLESSGGKKSIFINRGWCVPTLIGWGWSRLFPHEETRETLSSETDLNDAESMKKNSYQRQNVAVGPIKVQVLYFSVIYKSPVRIR